jgi:hypothetical protein
MRWLRGQGLTVRFTTNTDATAPAARADRLARRGFEPPSPGLTVTAARPVTKADVSRRWSGRQVAGTNQSARQGRGYTTSTVRSEEIWHRPPLVERSGRLVGQADLGVRIAGLKGWSRSVTVTRQGLDKVPECQVHRLVMPRRAPGRWDGRALLTTRTLRSAICTCGVQHAGDAAHARLAGGTRLRMWW